jgi:hypothetical protein
VPKPNSPDGKTPPDVAGQPSMPDQATLDTATAPAATEAEPKSQSRPQSRSHRLRGPAILAAALAIGAVIVGATYIGRQQLTACPSLMDAGGLRADTPVITPSDVTVSSASFKVNKNASPAIVTRSGQVTGTLPTGKYLWVVEQPRKDTRDSTLEHNPGDGRLYPVEALKPDGNGCWTMTNTLGYPQVLGITFTDYVVLVDDQTNADYSYGTTGFDSNDLYARGATILTTITIPTSP